MAHWVELKASHSPLPILVFIHGWGANASVWQEVSRALPGKHLALELPGFGNASPLAVDIHAYLDQLAETLPKQCVLVGWSLGGMIAAKLALQVPEKVRGVFCVASNPCFVQNAQWPHAMAQATFTQFTQSFEGAAQKTFKRFLLLQAQNDPQAKKVLATLKQLPPPEEGNHQAWAQALGWLQSLNYEALLNSSIYQWHIFGQHDALVPVQLVERLSANCVDVVEDGAHALPISHPALLAQKINRFLAPFDVLSKKNIADSFSAKAGSYNGSACIQKSVANHLVGMLPQSLPGAWLDLGCGTGFVGQAMVASNKSVAYWVAGDIALGMLQQLKGGSPSERVCALDAEQLPFCDNSFSGVVSSLALQWCDLKRAAGEVYGILQPGGHWYFTTLVEGTLGELQSAWQSVDAFAHVNEFLSANHVVDLVAAEGFKVECHSQHLVKDEFDHLIALLKSLKNIGAHNMSARQSPGLTTRNRLAQLEQAYLPFLEDGKYPASYQVLTVHARKV